MKEKEEQEYKPQIDIELLDKVLAITKIGREESKQIEDFIKAHIDPNVKICGSCPQQKRYALRRIKMWALSKGDQIEKDREYYNKSKEDENV